MRRRSLVTLLAGLACAAVPERVRAEIPYNATINDYGGVGLLQTRTARFMDEGGASIGGSYVFPQKRFWGTFQPFSWLETTFRFTDITNRRSATDRSFDTKIRLLKEGRYWPQLALGFQDLAGTGIFSSEYLVASRRVYDFDFTFGVAWGRLGSAGAFRNPFTYFADNFEVRSQGKSTGGTPGIKAYFSGREVGLFGGIEYSTPINGLRLLVEYDGDAYVSERSDPKFKKKIPVNFGVSYQPADWMNLSVGYERGDEVMVRGTLLANFNTAKPAPKFDRLPERVARRQPLKALESLEDARQASTQPPVRQPAADPLYQPAVYAPDDAVGEEGPGDVDVDRMFDMLADHGYQIEDFHFDGHNVTVQVSPLGLVWRSDTATLAAQAVAASLTLPAGVVTLVVRTPQGGSFTAMVKLKPEKTPDTRLASRRKPTISPAVPETGGYSSRWPSLNASLTEPLELDFKLRQTVAERLIAGLGQAGFVVDGVSVDPREVTVVLRNRKFFVRAQGIGRAARVIANRIPPSVEIITLVSVERGLEVSRVTLLRKELEIAAQFTNSVAEIWHSARVRGPDPTAPRPEFRPVGIYPNVSFTIDPKTRQSFFDPDRPMLFQVYMGLGAQVELTPRLNLNGEIGVNIFQNFTKSKRGAGSLLPHVRSDVIRYLQEGKNNLENLQLDYVSNIGSDWYGRLSVGYFEQMYGGISGEVLYAPYGRRWAVGLDANQVWKRNFNQRLGFQRYEVLTGHVSVHYELPWPRVLATVRGGRYLARDLGATFEVTRIFDSGVQLGGFFSLTDVSAAEFGEGSFDKGITLSLPLDLLLTNHTRYIAPITLRPLFRDGGQMVNVQGRLYPLVSKYSLGALDTGWNRLLD